MSLEAHLRLRRGALELDARLVIEGGETVALVGPNGAGKSSCLLAIAGLAPLEAGRVALDGEVLDGGPGGPFVPPEARGVGLVFQGSRLFPHLSALENAAFGLRARGSSRGEARRTALGWLERLGVAHRAAARPAELSGGEAQRVALARALAPGPRALLLDEPLAAVDASGRLELRRELAAHLADFPGPRLVVAHEASDALALADRVVVLEEGRVVQEGTAAELALRPGSRFVADLVGLNRFEGRCRAGVVTIGAGELVVSSSLDGEVVVSVHPRAVALFPERPAGSPRTVWRAPVLGVEALGDRARVRLGGPLEVVAEVTPAAVRELALEPGAELWVAIKATELVVAPR
jgi:molybdate transport system ATP-binding protein